MGGRWIKILDRARGCHRDVTSHRDLTSPLDVTSPRDVTSP